MEKYEGNIRAVPYAWTAGLENVWGSSLYTGYGTWKISEPSPINIGCGTGNFELHPPYRLWDLEERGASLHIYLSFYIKAVRLGNIPNSPLIGSRT